MAKTNWVTITGPMAWCETCPLEGFVYHGDSDSDDRKTIREAKKHAQETGHEVFLQRGQSSRVAP